MVRTLIETTTESTTMILRPQTLNIRNQFRNLLNQRVSENNPRLPSTPGITIDSNQTIPVIDREEIIELNNSTSSERRLEFMESIFSLENSDENRLFLILNTSNQVRTNLHDLLIRSANNSNISEEDLYRVGNIFLYTISNLDINGLIFRDVIQNIRESMVIYNTNQVYSILDNQINNYYNYLENTNLATENQLEDRVNEFNQEVDQRIVLNRKKMLYAGVGILGSMALTSLGMPPVGGLLVRSITPSVTNISSNSVEEIIRLRDVWDAALKKMLSIIGK